MSEDDVRESIRLNRRSVNTDGWRGRGGRGWRERGKGGRGETDDRLRRAGERRGEARRGEEEVVKRG